MNEQVVINTAPMITLARIGALDVAGRLPIRFVCPEQVRRELDEGRAMGHPDVSPAWLTIQRLRNPLSPLATAALDSGEAAVIHLAIELKTTWVCIDEWKGRRAALSVGLNVTGVLGLLGRAKKAGVIPALAPFVEKAMSCGIRYDRDLVRQVLKAVGE